MSGTHAPSILVVDDEVYLRELWQEVFRYVGSDIHTAGSGEEGVSVLQQTTLDIIITDIRMPGTDGFYLLDYIKRANLKNTKTFICSGFLEDLRDLSAYNIERIISKPFNVIEEIDYFSDLIAAKS